jgi:hypothetical protein
MTSLRSTITKANDLSARIGHDFGDYADLIVRKAGEKQRSEGLAIAASSTVATREPSRVSPSRPSGRVSTIGRKGGDQ